MSNAQPKWKTVTFWIISILLTAMFLFAGSGKLVPGKNAEFAKNFARYGYPEWFLYVTGTIEVSGALLVLVPKTRFYGAALLVCTMIGAVITHLRAGEGPMAIPALVLGTLSAVLAWNTRPAWLGRKAGTPTAAGA